MEARREFRLSLLAAERTVVPATAYWEEEWAPPLLEMYHPFAKRVDCSSWALPVARRSTSPASKHARDPDRYRSYFEEPSRAEYDRLKEMWRTRLRSTTRDIAADWREGLMTGDVLFEDLLGPGSAPGLDTTLDRVPEWLQSDAFIRDFVLGVLEERGVLLDPPQRSLIGQIINRGYVQSYLNEMQADRCARRADEDALDGLLVGANCTRLDVRRFEQLLSDLDVLELVAALTQDELLLARQSFEWEPVRVDLLARASRTGAGAPMMSPP